MKIFRYLPVILVGGSLVACGGSKPATAVNPSTVPAAEVKKVPAAPELNPLPEPTQLTLTSLEGQANLLGRRRPCTLPHPPRPRLLGEVSPM